MDHENQFSYYPLVGQGSRRYTINYLG